MTMMIAKSYLVAFTFLAFATNGVSASLFTSFSFSKLLYMFQLCGHESPWCPPPPCHLPGHHKPAVCQYYSCQEAQGRPGKECMFTGECGDNQECAATASFLGVESDSYYEGEDLDDNDTDYSYTTNVGDGSAATRQESTSSQNWMPYAVMGAVLSGFIIFVVLRKRDSIKNGSLGESLNGSKEFDETASTTTTSTSIPAGDGSDYIRA